MSEYFEVVAAFDLLEVDVANGGNGFYFSSRVINRPSQCLVIVFSY